MLGCVKKKCQATDDHLRSVVLDSIQYLTCTVKVSVLRYNHNNCRLRKVNILRVTYPAFK